MIKPPKWNTYAKNRNEIPAVNKILTIILNTFLQITLIDFQCFVYYSLVVKFVKYRLVDFRKIFLDSIYKTNTYMGNKPFIVMTKQFINTYFFRENSQCEYT